MDSARYEREIRKHKNRVYSYAVWMLRDMEEAKDVSQEAMVRLWQHREAVDGPAAKSWMLTTVNRLCLDRLRARKRRPEIAEDEVSPVDLSPDPCRLAASSETGRAIGAALSSLGPQDRAAVLMREVQGLSYDEIAGVLSVPLGTVKAKLHRAREKLRRRLAGAGVAP